MGAEREEVKKGGQRDRKSHERWPKTSDVINTSKETQHASTTAIVTLSLTCNNAKLILGYTNVVLTTTPRQSD